LNKLIKIITINNLFLNIIFNNLSKYYIFLLKWGLGIGDWGLGIGVLA